MSKERIRKPNIANNLIHNSVESFIISVELHNKFIFNYRYESVSILLTHAWELALKAYCYKHLKFKNILKKNNDGKYISLVQVVDKVFNHNTKRFRILKENIDSLNDYRNLVIHSLVQENIEQLVYEIIAKSVLLYRDFVKEFFPKYSLETIEDTFILPITFKLPFTSLDILTRNFSAQNAPKEIIEFVNKINSRIISLSSDGIEENIFISIKTEFTNSNNMDNTNITAILNQGNEDSVHFQKETKNRLVNDKSAQPYRGLLNEEEVEKNFPIPTKKQLLEMLKNEIGENFRTKGGHGFYAKITKELENEFKGIHWYPNTENQGKRYSNEFLKILIEKYN